MFGLTDPVIYFKSHYHLEFLLFLERLFSNFKLANFRECQHVFLRALPRKQELKNKPKVQ